MGDKSTESSDKNSRSRNWTVVVYPESAPSNWRDLIDEEHIEWVESPLHDKDVNPTGEAKKAHWHVLLMFGGLKSYKQVLDFIQPLNCPIPKQVHNSKSLIRYMAHLDNPDKYQYDQSKIIAHGGVDLADLLKPSAAEKYTYIAEMMNYCIEKGIVEYSDLSQIAWDERRDDWFPIICDNTLVMRTFLASLRHKKQGKSCAYLGSRPFDPDSGEILD